MCSTFVHTKQAGKFAFIFSDIQPEMEKVRNQPRSTTRYTCDYHMCGKSYVTKYALQHHTYVHTNLQPYRCPYCRLSFVSRHTKYNHIQKEHGQLHQETQINAKLQAMAESAVTKVSGNNREVNSARLSSSVTSNPFRIPLNPGQCPFCLNIYKHKFAVKVHISKMHRERFREYLQYYNDDPEFDNCTNVLVVSTPPQSSPPVSKEVMMETSQNRVKEGKADIQETFKPWFTSVSTIEDATIVANQLHIRDIPEPIGDLMLCHFCNEKFYNIKYLHWHIRNEHTSHRDEPDDNVSSAMTSVSERPLGPTQSNSPSGFQYNTVLGKFKARVQLGYEKPFQCFLCHHRFLDRSYLQSHMSLFHKKDDSVIIGTVSPGVMKMARRSSYKMTAPGNQNDRSQNNSIFSSITNPCTKEYYSGTTAEDRAKRYESRKAKLELGVGNNKSLTSAHCNVAANVTSTRKNNKAGLNRSYSPSIIASVKIVPLTVAGETITTDNGVVHCIPCGKIFYELALFKNHWNTEHKKFQNDTCGKSLLAANDMNQSHPKQSLQSNLNVLEENHKKIISSQWSRRYKNEETETVI
ncbi:unnamed protein product, partial [Allacma fusca]